MIDTAQVKAYLLEKLTQRVDQYIAHLEANRNDYEEYVDADWDWVFDFAEWDS